MRFQQFLIPIYLSIFSYSALAQPYKANWDSLNERPIPSWFQEARFGIFIHWGVYAAPSYAPTSGESTPYSEWYWHSLREKRPETLEFHKKNYGEDVRYPDLEPLFKAELFDPAEWAELFRKAGARYVVLTSKHHEGYCLWDSEEADRSWGRPWNAVSGTPGRDLLGDLTRAVRDAGLRMGYYYSLYEWYNPLWMNDKEAYIREVMTPQFKDLVTRYKPSVIFSDGEWDLPDTAWKSPELLAWLFNESPVAGEVVVNDRWGKDIRGKHAATYFTSEYGSGMGPEVVWEENRGIGNSYGYNRMEGLKDYKSSYDLVVILADIVSRGGNLLLDVGPTADGRIPVIMQQRLLDIGEWLKVNGEAIYGSTPWKHTRQWSEGQRPEVREGNYDTGYDVVSMTRPGEGKAHIEAFFTTKGDDLYVILPRYREQVMIGDLDPAPGTDIELLGSGKALPWEASGAGCRIDLSGISPGDLQHEIFVLKINNP